MHGIDYGHGGEPGAPLVRRLTSPKDDALVAARAAGLTVLEGRYRVEKYDREVAPENLYEIVECPPNLFLTAGVTKIWHLVTNSGAGATPHLDASNAYLAVGDSAAAVAAGQSDLQAATNKQRKLVSGAPVVSGNQVTLSAQFGTGDANFAWLEVGVATASTGQLISRSAITAPGLGTKVNTAVWVLNWTLSIS